LNNPVEEEQVNVANNEPRKFYVLKNDSDSMHTKGY